MNRYPIELDQMVVYIGPTELIDTITRKAVLDDFVPKYGQVSRIRWVGICDYKSKHDTHVMVYGYDYSYPIDCFVPWFLWNALKGYRSNIAPEEINNFKILPNEDIVYAYIECLKSSLS